MVKFALKSLTLPSWTSRLQSPDTMYGNSVSSSLAAVDVSFIGDVVVVVLLLPAAPVALLVEEVRLPDDEVSLLPVMICDCVVLPNKVALEDDVLDDVVLLLPVSDDAGVLADSGTSYIMAAMRPLAEKVEPVAAADVWFEVPVAFVEVALDEPAVEVVVLLDVVLPVLELFVA